MSKQEHGRFESLSKRHGVQQGPPKRKHVAEDPLTGTAANVKRIRQLRAAMEETLDMALRRDFFGAGSLEFTVQDGTIQEIRQRLERIDR